MTKDRLTYLLDRYLENTATEEELQEYADWYKRAGAEGPKLFEAGNTPQAQEYSHTLFTSIIDRVRVVEKEKKQASGKRRSLYLKWAAAAVIVVAGMLVFLFYNNQPARSVKTVAEKAAVQDTAKTKMVIVENHSNKKNTISLKDGSVVELYAGGTLRYEEPFSRQHRNVYLSGKGFFKVARDTTRPFTVYSHDIATTALGTSFTIIAWPEKNDVAVSLHTGKVIVQSTAQSGAARMKAVYLVPGQQVTCNLVTGLATLQSTTTKKAVHEAGNMPTLGSRTGFAISFDQAPMVTVLSTIEKGYSVHLEYDQEELADMLFSGRIRDKDSLSQVLKRIAALYNLKIKGTGKKYIIQKNH